MLPLHVAAQLGLGGELDAADGADGLAAVPGPVVGQPLLGAHRDAAARLLAPVTAWNVQPPSAHETPPAGQTAPPLCGCLLLATGERKGGEDIH